MLTLYSWTTPNGRKISIMLEELGLPYTVEPIDIGKNAQFAPAYLVISPNNKIPSLVDDAADGGSLALFESGAILLYLAEKTGKFLAKSGHARYQALAWLEWQIGGIGPMLGQLGHFALHAKEKVPYAIDRYQTEAIRLLGVLETQLAQHAYLAGEDYSVADIATYPWIFAAQSMMKAELETHFQSSPSVLRWLEVVGKRPAVARGMNVPIV